MHRLFIRILKSAFALQYHDIIPKRYNIIPFFALLKSKIYRYGPNSLRYLSPFDLLDKPKVVLNKIEWATSS